MLTWRAIDERGVAATVQQVLRVWPTVSLGKDVALGFTAGSFGSFRITLNGRSPVYPFAVNYGVSGHGQGHDLESGRVEFAAGETEKDVYFAVLQAPPPGTPDQQVHVRLDAALNLGARSHLTVTLTTANAAPRVMLAAAQEGQSRPVFVRSGEPLILAAHVEDPNPGDTHSFQWFYPAGAAVVISGSRLELRPQSLLAGIHRFEVLATDNGTPALGSRAVLDVVLGAQAPALPEGATEWADNGLPDHPAYNPKTRNVLPERAGELHHFMIEADPGVRLRLGPHALESGRAQAELHGSSDVALPADTASNVGGYFNFTVADLPQIGQSVNVVVPQRAPIPDQPVYRKFDSGTRTWRNFVQDAHNALASAPGAEGHCPPPQSPQYRAGLNPGDWCVQLTLRDGGPNDDDDQANGVVMDPGGVATQVSVTVIARGEGSSSRGGGGALDVWVLGVLVIVLALRGFGRAAWCLALGGLALSAPAVGVAREPTLAAVMDRTYLGVQVARVAGELTEGRLNTRLAEAGYAVTARYGDRHRSAGRLFVGYRWTPYFETQLGYTDLGEVAAEFSGQVEDVEAFLHAVNRLHPRSADGLELTARGRYPLTSRLALVGWLHWDSSHRSIDVTGATARARSAGTDGFAGVGLDLALQGRWSLGVEWTRYQVAGEALQFAGIGLIYRLGR